MTPEQAERIATALACPDEGRDVRALITEDNMVEYGWISTRMELDPDQLRGQKSAPKKAKAKAGPSTQARQSKTDASQPPKRKNLGHDLGARDFKKGRACQFRDSTAYDGETRGWRGTIRGDQVTADGVQGDS